MVREDAVTRYVRYEHAGEARYGIWDDDEIHELKGDLFTGATTTGRTHAVSDVTFLVPCEPSKVIAVGLNYASHREHVEKSEGVIRNAAGRPVPDDYPGVFAKFPTSLIPNGADIVFPADAKNVHFEGELALVIGKTARDVPTAQAREHVFGVTICNDLVERDWLLEDLQWFRAKGADGFGPIGPAIVTGLDYRSGLALETRVNGEVRQSSNTSELVFSPDELLSYCSRYVTLLPGDVIFTGTPGTTQAVVQGDEIEVEIEGIGLLRNAVAARRPAT
ncbi:MAG: fumarylacetoacetate hydrolase family protein [Actinophytocola sp.]|uniref:fumarylacetoacetate hydrolase family protein n=1 Tax=Actinophytocola sp. TaxID=1872138 RepID=UPI003D6BC8C9